MSTDKTQQVLELLDVIASFQGTKKTGVDGYHDYYEKAGYASTRIQDMGYTATDGLIAGLASENPKIRHHAVLLLGRIGDGRAREPLEALLKTENDSSLKQLIQTALKRLGDSGAYDDLVNKFASNNPDERLKALQGISNYGEIAASHLIDALSDKNEKIRSHAAQIIGFTCNNSDVVVEPLIKTALTDAVQDVCVQAIRTLASNRSGVPTIAPALLEIAQSSNTVKILHAVYQGLSKHPVPEAIPVLIEGLQQERNLQWQAILTLKEYDRKGILTDDVFVPLSQYIEETTAGDDPSTADVPLQNAAEVIAHVGGSDAVEPLVKLIRTNVKRASQKACGYLGEIDGDIAREALVSLLAVEDKTIRLLILYALEKRADLATLQALKDYQENNELDEDEADAVNKAIKAIENVS